MRTLAAILICPIVVCLIIACSAHSRQDTLHAGFVSTEVACDSLDAIEHQRAMAVASTAGIKADDAAAKIAALRVDFDKAHAVCDAAYKAIGAAVGLNDDPSLANAVASIAQAAEAVAALKSQLATGSN